MKFTPEHEALRQTWQTLIEREINPYVDEWEKEGAFPAHALFKKMGDAGLLGVAMEICTPVAMGIEPPFTRPSDSEHTMA